MSGCAVWLQRGLNLHKISLAHPYLPASPGVMNRIALVFLIALIVSGPLSANEDGWRIRAALALGAYTPDQERRQLADSLGAAFFFRGLAFQTPWQGKGFASIPLEVEYNKDRIRGWVEWDGQSIDPKYFSYANFNDFTYEGHPARYTSFGLLGNTASRSTSVYRLGYRLNADASERSFYLYGGYMAYSVEYSANGFYFNTAEIQQSGSASGVAFTRTGTIQEKEMLLGGLTSYRAQGAVWGFLYQENIGQKFEFRGHLGFFNLSGNMQAERRSLSQSSGSVTTRTATASSTASEDEAYFNYRSESGRLFVNGSTLSLALYYKWRPASNFFVSMQSSAATVKDSEVFLLLFTTNPDVDPYKDTINGETIYSLALRTNYPGSAAPESVAQLAFGFEHRF